MDKIVIINICILKIIKLFFIEIQKNKNKLKLF